MANSVYAIYGVPQLTVSQLSFMLRTLQIAHSIASPRDTIKVDGNDAKARPVICVGADIVRRKASKIRIAASLFVIDHPVALSSISATLMNVKSTGKYSWEYSPIQLQDVEFAVTCATSPIELNFTKENVIYDTLRSVKSNSVLSSVQTALYRVPSMTRAGIQQAAYSYLLGTSLRSLEKTLLRADRGDILKVMKTPQVLALRSAVSDVLSGISVSTAAKTYGVPAFDIRYVLSQRR